MNGDRSTHYLAVWQQCGVIQHQESTVRETSQQWTGWKTEGHVVAAEVCAKHFTRCIFYFQDYSGFRDRLQGEHLTACQRISISRPKQFRVQLGCRKSWSILCPLPIIDNKSVWKANVHETWTFQAEKQINENQSNSTVWFVP